MVRTTRFHFKPDYLVTTTTTHHGYQNVNTITSTFTHVNDEMIVIAKLNYHIILSR